ncbi:MAG: hypothetical protein ACLGIB_09885 [Actinomycetota bacterium]
MAQAIEATRGFKAKDGAVARKLDRSVIDKLISWAGAVVAVALVGLGAAAIYGGSFALDNVRDRLEPQNITLGPASDMTPEEKAVVGKYAGEKVDTGTEAEAYSRYIGLHVQEIGGGKTYAELGGPLFALEAQIEEAAAAGEDTVAMEEELAALRGQRDTVFKGETLRAILLNAYGWWMVGQITFYAGFGMVIAGLILALLVALGFWHARRAQASTV